MSRAFARDATPVTGSSKRSRRLWVALATGALSLIGAGAWALRSADSRASFWSSSLFGGSAKAAVPELNPEVLTAFVTSKAEAVQGFWLQDFQQRGQPFKVANVLLHATNELSQCAGATRAAGSFYCGAEQVAHFDLALYRALHEHCPGQVDAAETYVVAHTLAHHVQTTLHLDALVDDLAQVHKGQRHAMGVRLELQADCLAGVWARRNAASRPLEPGNFEVAQRCVSEVATEGPRKAPLGSESFSHASSKQRAYWFSRGYAMGKIQECDTFAPAQP